MSLIRSIVAAGIGVLLAVPLAVGLDAAPAMAGTGVYSRNFPRDRPRFYFDVNRRSPQRSTLTLYYSSGRDRVRRFVSVRAGSGLGSLDECAKSRGVLPVGHYRVWFLPSYPAGNPAVRGNVWRLSDHVCRNGRTVRNDLFIHSSGAPGAPFRTYRTYGCIKVNQPDRARLATAWRSAWANGRGELIVRRR